MATRIPEFTEIIEQNDQTEARSEHLDALRDLVGNAYPNKFERSTLSGGEDTITAVLDHGLVADIAREMAEVRSKLAERERPPADIKDALNERLKALGNVRVAGRLTTPPRGNFVHLTDGRNKLQIYAKKGAFALVKNDGLDTLDEERAWEAWQLIDHGDFVGVEGYLFVTNTGEVSVHVEKLQFLAKAMLPMPDKMHGIADAEILPATVAPELLTDLLRDDLGFNGVILTDASIMVGLTSALPRRRQMVQAITAGCDMILFFRNYDEDFGFVRDAVRSGEITADRLDDALARAWPAQRWP